jgi:predicted transposase/invertase (TIGR01784 family)
MSEENTTTSANDVTNPHDKLFRETWSNLDNAKSFLQHYLPGHVLACMELETLEISKDSFVEKELSDYYSDMLYKVNLSGMPGCVYVLFEHKSYYDRYVHLQLLEYMVKIWRLHIKQKKQKKKELLPIVIPLLICHGKRPWPEEKVRVSSLLAGPVEALSGYIPDFGFLLHDLNRFTDTDIKGTVMARVVLLLFKHVFAPDLQEKLPGILSLMKTLMEKETGLQYLETVLRYLFNTVDDISAETIKEVAEQALSTSEGEYIMTLAERLRKEGEMRGEIRGKLEGRLEGRLEGEIRGKLEGMKDAIELGMVLKFPDQRDYVMAEVQKINDLDTLIKIKEAIKTAKAVSELQRYLGGC